MLYAIPEPARISLPIMGSDARFPVRRINCEGVFYAANAVDIGRDPDKEPPLFVQKSPTITFELSRLFDIGAGDLILTGTPAGVGSLRPGDHMQARIAGLGVLDVAVVQA